MIKESHWNAACSSEFIIDHHHHSLLILSKLGQARVETQIKPIRKGDFFEFFFKLLKRQLLTRKQGFHNIFSRKHKEGPNQGSGTWIAAFQAALSKANSLVIFQSFRSLLTAFSQVKFGRPLLLFTSLFRLMMPLCTGASGDLRCTCPNHLSRCCTSFSSIGPTPRRSRISSFRTRSILVCPQIQRNIRISATLSC